MMIIKSYFINDFIILFNKVIKLFWLSNSRQSKNFFTLFQMFT